MDLDASVRLAAGGEAFVAAWCVRPEQAFYFTGGIAEVLAGAART